MADALHYGAEPGSEFSLVEGNVHARMRVGEDGSCIVLKGSQLPKEPQKTFLKNQKGYFRLRQQLLEAGVIVPFTSDRLIFDRDHAFTSPTAAAAVIRGGPGSLAYWKGKDGRTLQALRRALNEAEDGDDASKEP